MSAAVGRAWLRMKARNGLQVEDGFHIAAVILLTVGTVITQLMQPWLYDSLAIVLNPVAALGMKDIVNTINMTRRLNWAFLAISWGTIFVVKAAFLHLFYHLLSRLPGLKRYWWLVTVFTILSFIFCVAESLLICPKLGLEASQSSYHYYPSSRESDIRRILQQARTFSLDGSNELCSYNTRYCLRSF